MAVGYFCVHIFLVNAHLFEIILLGVNKIRISLAASACKMGRAFVWERGRGGESWICEIWKCFPLVSCGACDKESSSHALRFLNLEDIEVFSFGWLWCLWQGKQLSCLKNRRFARYGSVFLLAICGIYVEESNSNVLKTGVSILGGPIHWFFKFLFLWCYF